MIHTNSLYLVLLLMCVLCTCSEFKQQIKYNATEARQERVIHLKNQQNNQGFCSVNGVDGICMTRIACTGAGKSQLGSGGCGTYSICCDVPVKCDSNINSKHSIIKSPSTIPERCTYTIGPYNTNVCQIRVDFTKAIWGAPSSIDGSCANQFLDFNGMLLCGDISDQHLFVDIDQSSKSLGNEFSFQFLREGMPTTTTDSWIIRVMQLECPKVDNSNKYGIFTIPRRNSLSELRRLFTPRFNDAGMLAPRGCDQYYTEPKGHIKSFNYKATGNGQYPFNLHYTICFKRRSGDSNLELSGTGTGKFDMGVDSVSLPPEEKALDQFCHPTISPSGQPLSNDYLLVPPTNIYSANTLYDPILFCGKSLEGQKVVTESFMITFNSDEYLSTKESGFDLTYSIS